MKEEIENKLQEILTKFADDLRARANESLLDIESDILPYVSSDTESNASYQAADIVKQIIAGNFTFEGDYAVVQGVREYAPRVYIKFSECAYDSLRDKIIERMPSCPKDAKIKALEEALRHAERRY